MTARAINQYGTTKRFLKKEVEESTRVSTQTARTSLQDRSS
jgi:hypothetical protein